MTILAMILSTSISTVPSMSVNQDLPLAVESCPSRSMIVQHLDELIAGREELAGHQWPEGMVLEVVDDPNEHAWFLRTNRALAQSQARHRGTCDAVEQAIAAEMFQLYAKVAQPIALAKTEVDVEVEAEVEAEPEEKVSTEAIHAEPAEPKVNATKSAAPLEPTGPWSLLEGFSLGSDFLTSLNFSLRSGAALRFARLFEVQGALRISTPHQYFRSGYDPKFQILVALDAAFCMITPTRRVQFAGCAGGYAGYRRTVVEHILDDHRWGDDATPYEVDMFSLAWRVGGDVRVPLRRGALLTLGLAFEFSDARPEVRAHAQLPRLESREEGGFFPVNRGPSGFVELGLRLPVGRR